MQKILHVSDNPEHFSSIGSALAQIPANNTTPVIIEIAPGIYHEKLTINKPYITLRGMGESSAHTVISYDDYALDLMEDGSKRGTFRTYTLFIDTHDVTLQHLTIENASGDSATHGQAIALYADGDRLMIDSCRLLGHQDTLFTGPLPEKERQPGGFIGPKQFAPRINGRQYYKNCYICGDIDFIFGSATAYFEHCTLESLLRTKTSAQSDLVSTTSTLHDSGCDTSALCHSNSDMVQKNYTLPPIQGYVTAASTPESQEYGYVFSNCKLISKDCPPNSVYLGRPWRNYAKTVFLECALGNHIHECGFHDWKKEDARNTVLYAEYRNYPASSADTTSNNRSLNDDIHCIDGRCIPYPHRAEYVCELDAVQAEHFSKENVLSGADYWNP